jgi:hypothetical protein
MTKGDATTAENIGSPLGRRLASERDGKKICDDPPGVGGSRSESFEANTSTGGW